MTKARLSSKRFGNAVKTLNEIALSGKTEQRRLRAVELLLSLYARHDLNVQRKEEAKARQMERGKLEDHREPVEAAETQEQASEPDMADEDQQIQDVFARLMNKGRTTDAVTAN